MIRLALAVGFLAVFGIVGYAIVLLLTHHFKTKTTKTTIKHGNNP
jgi:hypothetical protein